MTLAGRVDTALGKCSEAGKQPEPTGTVADSETLLQGMLGGEDCDSPEPHSEEVRNYGKRRGR